VPLALIYWSNVRGIVFIDRWAVRRRPASPAHSRRWHALVGDRRAAESEAMVLQFQDQIADMFTSKSVKMSTVEAGQYFHQLPPAGLLPLARRDRSGKDFNGINPNTFFGGHAPRPAAYIDGGILRSLLADASKYEPVDLTRGGVVWLYQVLQNDEAFNTTANVTPYILFTTAQMLYRGAALLDISRLQKSNFG
jgi:hypothetical protein